MASKTRLHLIYTNTATTFSNLVIYQIKQINAKNINKISTKGLLPMKALKEKNKISFCQY